MFYFIQQTVREGEREYTTSFTEEANSVEDLEKIYNVEHDCGVDSDNMEIYTSDIETRTMTQHEFDVVSRFI
jgi:hypothetical protein